MSRDLDTSASSYMKSPFLAPDEGNSFLLAKPLKGGNQKKKSLDLSMGTMNTDLALMKRAREDSKIRLEQRFQELHKYNKEFIDSETKRINETLSTFQTRIGNDFEKLKQSCFERHDQLVLDVDKKFQSLSKKCSKLEKSIKIEQEERIKHVDEKSNALLMRIEKLEKALELETDLRKQKEQELAKSFSDENHKLRQQFEKDKLLKEEKLKEIATTFKFEINEQQKRAEDSQSKSGKDLQAASKRLEREMNKRFERQDGMVNSLGQMIKTFQDTLKLIGEDM